MVDHIQSAPYHPASNGQAERFVQSLKQALNVTKQEPGPQALQLPVDLLKFAACDYWSVSYIPVPEQRSPQVYVQSQVLQRQAA